MSLSRRKFLRAGTLVAVSAGIPLRTLAAETLSPPSPLLPNNGHLNAGLYLNRETFSRYLNTKFSLSHGDAEAIAVRSIQVNDWTPKAGRPSAAATGRECFSVVFIGSHSAPLRQETYTVTHDSIGKFAMLVVPVGKDKEGVYYEAVFNRLH
jgi:uncharacterized protein DUF6916